MLFQFLQFLLTREVVYPDSGLGEAGVEFLLEFLPEDANRLLFLHVLGGSSGGADLLLSNVDLVDLVLERTFDLGGAPGLVLVRVETTGLAVGVEALLGGTDVLEVALVEEVLLEGRLQFLLGGLADAEPDLVLLEVDGVEVAVLPLDLLLVTLRLLLGVAFGRRTPLETRGGPAGLPGTLHCLPVGRDAEQVFVRTRVLILLAILHRVLYIILRSLEGQACQGEGESLLQGLETSFGVLLGLEQELSVLEGLLSESLLVLGSLAGD